MDVISTLAASAVGGVLSSLLTIALTPRLQHHFWRYQRRTETQLATIQEFNRVTAEFISGYIANPEALPSTEFFAALDKARSQVKPLFSSSAADTVQAVVNVVGPRLGSATGDRTPTDFGQRRDAALAALYAEALPEAVAWPWGRRS